MSVSSERPIKSKKRRSTSQAESEESATARPAKKRRSAVELAQLALQQSDDESHEAQVLSHKEQRKRKRGKAAEATEQSEAKVSRPARSQFGVWIGNLAYATTEEKLAGFLREGGCTAPTRFHMPRGKSPQEKNRGFAYVDFEDEAAAKLAVTLSEGHLDGRKLLIKLANDFDGRPAGAAATLGGQSLSKSAKKIADRQRNQPAPSLFVGNLGFDVDSDRLRNMFQGNHLAALQWVPKAKLAEIQAGDGGQDKENGDDNSSEDKAIARARASVGIRKIRVGTFEDSGKCKGWAFVDFNTVQEATVALLNIRNHHLANRALVVEYATQDAVRRGGSHLAKDGITRKPHRPLRKPASGPSEEIVEEIGEPPKVEEAVPRPLRASKAARESRKKKTTPGAVLAKAKRAKVGIVEGAPSGKKIVF